MTENEFKNLKYFALKQCKYPKNFCDGKKAVEKTSDKSSCTYYINGKCTHPENPKNLK